MTSTLYVDNLEPNLGTRVMAAGHVVQVVQVTGTNNVTLSNTSWTAVAGTCSITPTDANSKIYITHHAGGLSRNARSHGMRLKRDGTVVLEGDRHSGYHADPSYYGAAPHTLIYLDSPNTTSQVDYTFELKQSASGSLRHNDYDTTPNTWVTVLMEVAG